MIYRSYFGSDPPFFIYYVYIYAYKNPPGCSETTVIPVSCNLDANSLACIILANFD